jgi:hypothetical protein
MFKEIKSGFSKFFTKERILIIFIFVLLSWALLSYSNSKMNFANRREGFSNTIASYSNPSPSYPSSNMDKPIMSTSNHSTSSSSLSSHNPMPSIHQSSSHNPMPSIHQSSPQVPIFNETPKQNLNKNLTNTSTSSYTPNDSSSLFGNVSSLQTVANPSDLLPKDENSQWSALNPTNMSQGNIMMPDLLQAGYHIGLDTIGQTLRNPNYQLRSDPVIPKQDIGPWHQSTIEPDIGRIPLEVGEGLK